MLVQSLDMKREVRWESADCPVLVALAKVVAVTAENDCGLGRRLTPTGNAILQVQRRVFAISIARQAQTDC
jgi:hypothetical protein